MKVYIQLNDLLWTFGKQEDPRQMVPEVGAIVKGGPDFSRGIIVSPDIAKMENRHMPNMEIEFWYIIFDKGEGIDTTEQPVSVSTDSFVVAASGHSLAVAMALVESQGSEMWNDQFRQCT